MRRVADVMQEPPVLVEPSTTVQETSARMLDAGVHAAVVVEHGAVCGLATAEQVSTALSEGYDATETPIGVIAERHPPMFAPEETLADAHLVMRAEGHRLAAVVGAKGEPLGLLEDAEAAPLATRDE
jgi:CBS domain-containing protein